MKPKADNESSAQTKTNEDELRRSEGKVRLLCFKRSRVSGPVFRPNTNATSRQAVRADDVQVTKDKSEVHSVLRNCYKTSFRSWLAFKTIALRSIRKGSTHDTTY